MIALMGSMCRAGKGEDLRIRGDRGWATLQMVMEPLESPRASLSPAGLNLMQVQWCPQGNYSSDSTFQDRYSSSTRVFLMFICALRVLLQFIVDIADFLPERVLQLCYFYSIQTQAAMLPCISMTCGILVNLSFLLLLRPPLGSNSINEIKLLLLREQMCLLRYLLYRRHGCVQVYAKGGGQTRAEEGVDSYGRWESRVRGARERVLVQPLRRSTLNDCSRGVSGGRTILVAGEGRVVYLIFCILNEAFSIRESASVWLPAAVIS